MYMSIEWKTEPEFFKPMYFWETETANGLNIAKFMEGLFPTTADCKEGAVHLQPLMTTEAHPSHIH